MDHSTRPSGTGRATSMPPAAGAAGLVWNAATSEMSARRSGVVSALVGGSLVLLGLTRRSTGGAVAALAGGGMIYRAATGHCHLYEAVGVNTAVQGSGRDATHASQVKLSSTVTIGKSAEEIDRLWRQPDTLPRIMAHLAEVTPASEGRWHWKVVGPLGITLEWDTHVVEDRQGQSQRWESEEGADLPNEGSIRYRSAPADRGTEVTLQFRFQPPGGMLGAAAARQLRIIPRLVAETSLRYLKSLAETGEIPTTEHQPAARPGGR